MCSCVLASGGLSLGVEGQAVPPSTLVTSQLSAVKHYGKIPLGFERNGGQAEAGVQYLSRGSGFTLALKDREAVLSLREGRRGAAGRAQAGDDIRMQMVGAGAGVRAAGLDRLPGTANYLLGSDPAGWHSGLPTFAKVGYAGVYPGVDLVFYGDGGRLEYDFVVAAGADAGAVKLRFAGAKRLALEANGDLRIEGENGKIAFHQPVVYQEIDGKRQEREGHFQLLAGNTVGFTLGAYDRGLPLVIDPALVYSTYLDSPVNGIAVDGAGAAYLTGIIGSEGAYIRKLNPAGTALEYTTYLSGGGAAIAVDGTGNAYTTGLKEDYEAGVYKLNSTGTGLAYSTTLASGDAIAIDAMGNAYVGGDTTVSKLNASGSALLYSKSLTGARIGAIALGKSGEAFVAGSTTSSDFPTTPGAFQTTYTAGYYQNPSAFITKIDPSGSFLVYSTFFSGSYNDSCMFENCNPSAVANSIAVDEAGNAYIAGQGQGIPVTPGGSPVPTDYHHGGGAFVAKLNPLGSALVYSTSVSGRGSEAYGGRGTATGIALNSSGDAYITGYTDELGFPVTAGAYQTLQATFIPLDDQSFVAFVSELNPTGTSLLYSTLISGSVAGDFPSGPIGLARDSAGSIYIAGQRPPIDYPVTTGTLKVDYPMAFVTKLDLAASTIATGANTTITEAALPGAPFLGQPVTITVDVTSQGKEKVSSGLVTFREAGGFYSKYLGSASVGSNGRATLTTTALDVGPFYIEAFFSSPDSDFGPLASYTYINVNYPQPAKLRLVSGTHQRAIINTPFASPLVVQVLDAIGHPYAGAPVVFSTPPTGETCTFTNVQSFTDSNGIASAQATANGYAGPAGYTPIVTVPGLKGNVEFFLVNTKAAATLSFNHLSRTYTGYPLGVFATTSPAGLHVDFSYDGNRRAPTAVGTYTVVGTINDGNYQGSATGTLTILPRP